METVKEYDFPVMFGFPAGHGERNMAMPLGRTVEMVVDGNSSRIEFK
jgi:muramoyltetrapeptide carboxypeptidase